MLVQVPVELDCAAPGYLIDGSRIDLADGGAVDDARAVPAVAIGPQCAVTQRGLLQEGLTRGRVADARRVGGIIDRRQRLTPGGAIRGVPYAVSIKVQILAIR